MIRLLNWWPWLKLGICPTSQVSWPDVQIQPTCHGSHPRLNNLKRYSMPFSPYLRLPDGCFPRSYILSQYLLVVYLISIQSSFTCRVSSVPRSTVSTFSLYIFNCLLFPFLFVRRPVSCIVHLLWRADVAVRSLCHLFSLVLFVSSLFWLFLSLSSGLFIWPYSFSIDYSLCTVWLVHSTYKNPALGLLVNSEFILVKPVYRVPLCVETSLPLLSSHLSHTFATRYLRCD